LIRDNNNIVWKNFDVEDMFGGGYAYIEFQVQGWLRVRCKSDLEFDLSELPEGVKCYLKIVKRITKGVDTVNMTLREESDLYSRYDMESYEICALKQMSLEPSDNTEATLTVELPDDAPDGVYNLWVRQIVANKEVGRISRRIVVGDHPYVGNRNTKELHIRGQCEWERKMSGKNRVAFHDPELALKQGYNGCATCMPEIDTDKLD
jgi:hypothetical protein